MASTGAHGHRYRVRYRRTGRTITDGTYDTADAAHARANRLDHLTQAAKRPRAPAPGSYRRGYASR